MDEQKTFSQNELCDKKQGIQLTSLLNHTVPRTDGGFIAKALIFNTNGDAQDLGVGGGRGPPLVITEVWSTPPLGIAVMPRGVEVGRG